MEDKRLEKAIKIIEENGWDKKPPTYLALLQDHPSPKKTYSPRDGACSSSPKEGPP